ncbi:MAG: PhzF family phenazine biosynthesis protein [Alkaliphilus sp.]|nr:PhzF family phenazine biosynthesis protein [Alkaliphilus sp.]
MKKRFYQVDAFTNKCFGGNSAGVVSDARGLSEYQMKKIANEMNLSETAFVFPSTGMEYDYDIRYFTPTQEVDLCGHATIAAFKVLCEEKNITISEGTVQMRQKTKAGTLAVELIFEEEVLKSVMMTQTSPRFFEIIEDLSGLAEVFGLSPMDIGIKNLKVLPQIVSTGLRDIIMPVKSMNILKNIKPDFEKLTALSNRLGIIGVHTFALGFEGEVGDLVCRNFAPAAGINEETATGTSNGALGAYLVKNNVISLEKSKTIICKQGQYMDRPSTIVVCIEGSKDDMTVKVGGQAVVVLSGTIYC